MPRTSSAVFFMVLLYASHFLFMCSRFCQFSNLLLTPFTNDFVNNIASQVKLTFLTILFARLSHLTLINIDRFFNELIDRFM